MLDSAYFDERPSFTPNPISVAPVMPSAARRAERRLRMVRIECEPRDKRGKPSNCLEVVDKSQEEADSKM